jgi:hypothetical protein
MLRGYIDCVTTLGYVEGWAFDTEEYGRVVEVSILSGEQEVAWGLAHRFREDLMTASYGTGWCAYRLRLSVLIDQIREVQLLLVERTSGLEIASTTKIRLVEDAELPVSSIEALAGVDPTLLNGVWQLSKCERLFMKYISDHGVEAFLSAAYSYVLGRPMDSNGRTMYLRCLKQGTLTTLGILKALEASDEFRSRVQALAAPSADHFPFR